MADASAAPAPPFERHLIALFFHLVFKAHAVVWYIMCAQALAVVWYIMCTWVSDSFVTNFVVCIVLIAMDFWTVKNVTGRLLVGLRWWNEANDSGSAWRFESAPEGSRHINAYEKRMFWILLGANCVVWAVFGFFSLIRLKFEYLIIPIIGFIMGSSNFVGYFKCSREAGDQVKSMAGSMMTKTMTSMFTRSKV
eukprot:gene3768-13831_t